ncbi:MAG TPA: efflux transporter outer membrane subunit [Opitutaceae bacterium]|nr:efflux transporter outer membrane subunit [Opitutaceae bacterium]
MSRRSLLLLPALLLGGCAVGPGYHRPDVGAPAATRGQAAPESASLADLGWWELYRDPALDALVRAALADGFDARIAAARVQQARALALEARGPLFPGLGYAGNADRGRNTILGNPSPSGTGATGNGFDGYLAATWELDLWGRVRRLDEAARDQYLESAQAQRGVWLSLVAETASDYFQLLELDEELAVTRDASQAFGESLRLFNQRLKGGIASRLETASAQAAQASEAAQVPLVERAIAAQENELSVLLGRNPGPIERGAALSAHAAPPAVPAGLPSELLERRPDVKAAEYAAMATNAQIGATIGSFLPRIGLSALFGGVSPRLQDITSRRAEVWNVGAQVTGPIFQAGTLRGEYLQAKAAWELAKLRYEQTALGAFADVANALVSRQKLEQSRLEQEREVAAYQEAVKVATERYKAGEASYYELLQAQEQLFPAELTLARTRRDELISVVDLYKALGGGWNLKDAAAWSGR